MSNKPQKISQHPVYDDPTAFHKNWRAVPIVPVTDGSLISPLAKERPVLYYRFGKTIAVILCPPTATQGWFMSIQKRGSYPSWDEMVWLRYNLIPDAADMALRLPNLDNYINKENTQHKNVFTMEQAGWILTPPPVCEQCGKPLKITSYRDDGHTAEFICETDLCTGGSRIIDFNTWNEAHGHGLLGKRY